MARSGNDTLLISVDVRWLFRMTDSKTPLIGTLVIFLKGLFMGGADIIPGVSGGTIALITGIYERFVNALRSIDLKFVPYLFYGFKDRKYFGKARENIASIDFRFLLPLAGGILVAFLALANIMGMLLEDFPSYTYAFFLGLILCSAVVIYLGNREHIRSTDMLVGVVGFLVGIVIVGLQAIQTDHSVLIILFSGMITFCAMILPGISGAFILLILGQYGFLNPIIAAAAMAVSSLTVVTNSLRLRNYRPYGDSAKRERGSSEAIDPVCKMKVRKDSAAAVSEYEGKRYYFCAQHCKEEFERSPDKYIGST